MSPCQGLDSGSIPGTRTRKTDAERRLFLVRVRKQIYLLSSGNRKPEYVA